MSFEWMNDTSRKILKSGYLLEGEEPEQRVWDICKAAEERLNIEGFAEKMYEYMGKGYYSLSSPVWSNYGRKDRGLAVSCFGSHVGDSIPEILYAQTEVGVMSKLGGGTSVSLSNLRPRGSSITNNGKTSGAVHFARLFEQVTDVVSQGSQRRGRVSPYLDMSHEDISEFLDIATDGNMIQSVTTGVTVSDSFMEETRDGDSKKRGNWGKMLKTRGSIGFPYVVYTDNMNRNKPQVYKDKGMEIKASNLCLTGDQRVVTSKGYLTAKELYDSGEELTLHNGFEEVKASEMKLREKDAKTIKVTLSNGLEHKVTEYHGIPVVGSGGQTVRVAAKDLKIGDRVEVQSNKGLFGNLDMKDEAFLLGIYQSDGSQSKDMIHLDIWENDFDILEEIEDKFSRIHYKYGCDSYEITNQYGKTFSRGRKPATFHECSTRYSDVRKKRLSSKTLKKALNFEKGYVPDWIWESNEATQWEYIRGLLIADGTATQTKGQGEPVYISYAEINKSFLKDLQLIFNNMGLKSSIRMLREAGETLMPDGKGGHKMYQTKDCYRLIVGNKPSALEIEKNTGFLTRKGLFLENREYRDNTKKAFSVESIEYAGREDVYCPTVMNDEHIFVSQGFRTFNCSEIALPTSEDESFVCVLSSMNLAKWDEWKDTDAVKVLTYFLDTVVSESIEKLESMRHSGDHEKELTFEFMKRAHKFMKRHRALGAGTLAYNTLLQSKRIPFESKEARDLNKEMHRKLEKDSHEASRELAEMFGEPEILKGYGMRNTTTTAIAPTKSSSAILGGVSQGIEPIFSNYFVADFAKAKVEMKNPHLEELLGEHGKNTADVWQSIAQNDGSVQHLAFLSEREKDTFKTFREIAPEEIIDQAADRQEFIDQSQSLNLVIDGSYTPKQVNALMYRAWEKGVCSLYYQHGVNASKMLAASDCKACEA